MFLPLNKSLQIEPQLACLLISSHLEKDSETQQHRVVFHSFLSSRRKVSMMNHCAIQQKHAFTSREERRNSVPVPNTDRRDALVCPKPRRLGVFNSTLNEPDRPIRWPFSHQAEVSDAKAGTDLMDIILSKGDDYSTDQSCTPHRASSPPFFSGSPPSRVANPLIHDARFGDEKITQISFLQQTAAPNSGHQTSPSAKSAMKGGCVRVNFGSNPAVRVEGFNCLDRDSRHCSISALA